MATQTTGGGSTTSFTNTPQANGDTFLKGEDQTGVFLLDVMANDLGGNAKVLWSLDDGSGLTTDLLESDIGEVAATTDDHSAHGAKIWICNGKVAYDATTLDAAFQASLQALAVGESATDTFTYAIRLANGTLAWTTATVVYTGSNDAPVISVGSSDSAGDTLDETNSGLSTSGTLTVVDPDTSDVVDTSVTGVVLSGDTGTLASGDVIGMLSIVDGTDNDLQADLGNTNNLHWAFNSGAVAFDYLADGEALTLTYTLTSSDGHGGSDTQTVTITIEGTNDGPAIVAGGDLDGAVEEELGVYTDSGSFGFTDVDASDVHSVSATPGGLGYLGTLTPSVSDDSTGDGSGTIGWSFSVANADLQFLAEGETRTQTYTVTVDDGHGGTASETVTVVLTGDNDPVVITVGASDSAGDTLAETNLGLSTSGSLTVTDIDTSDVVDTTVTNLAISGNQGSLLQADLEAMLGFTGGTENNLAANTGDSNNLLWSFDSGSEAFNYLAAGESLTLTYTLTSSDGQGSTDTQDVTIVINGTNDAPVITVGASDSAGDTLAETNLGLSTSGSLTATDLDTNDVVDTTVTNLAISGNQGSLLQADLEAMLGFTGGTENDLAANTGDSNNLLWSFDSGSEAFNYLASGESLTLTYTLTSSDGHGGTDTQDVTIVINGTNDAPVITSNSGGATASVSIDENTTAVTTVTATDVDSPAITYSIVGGADSAKFTIDPNTGVLSFVNAPDFENPTDVAGGSSVAGNNVYDVVVQASDGSLVDTQAIAVTVNDVNAPPVITSNGAGATAGVSIDENTTAVTTVAATDDGENNNTLTYSIVGGADSAKFTIDPNTGVLSFVSAPDFENPTDVAGGSSVAGNNVYDVVVQASDGSLVDTQAIAVTVTDVNAAPVITSNGGGVTASVDARKTRPQSRPSSRPTTARTTTR